MALDATNIIRMLYQHFVNYEYRLNNAFVYLWESDFFAMSKSGYFVEVEVKVSRSDFFRDFEKDKHRLFKAHLAKRSIYFTSTSARGDLICAYKEGQLDSEGQSYWTVLHNGKRGYWVNDWQNVSIRHYKREIWSEATRIHAREVGKQKCPNQLYFACPDNLIKLEEIPSYAGLIYCGTEAKVIRRAPYLHKVKQDMTRELLKKFYHLWEYKQKMENKIELSGQFKLFTEKQLNDPIK